VSASLQLQQWEALRSLLSNAVEHSAFQRSRLGSLVAQINSLADFSQKVPLTKKSALAEDQNRNLPYGTNQTRAAHQYQRFCQTSGTTARPLAVWDTAESWEWLLQNWREGYRMAGVKPGMVAFFAFSFGPFLGFWTAFEAGLSLGLRCIPGGGLGTIARLHALLEHQVEVLCCTPTYALHLAGAARQAGVDLSQSRVRRILLAGEPGGSLSSVRLQLAGAWPAAEVVDHYGLTEVGPVAFGLEGAPCGLRVLEERYYAEVLDASGAPVVEGELGELVLTPLGRCSWPLFRYQTGDIVRPRKTAAGLELEGGILGRMDDMVIVRGVNLYPSAVEDVVRKVPEIGEYRVTVHKGAGLAEISVEIESPGSEGIAPQLEAEFERAFSLRIPVRDVQIGTLPQFEMKARRWVYA